MQEYDKHYEEAMVDLGNFGFSVSKYEIWKAGQKIENGNFNGTIEYRTLKSEPNIEEKIKISLSEKFSSNQLRQNFYFDCAYTCFDRIMIAIISYKSNCDNINSYSGFLNFAPFHTRKNKFYEFNEPYAMSVFTLNKIPKKIQFSIAISQINIQFYIKEILRHKNLKTL